jgi:hypothetical protein
MESNPLPNPYASPVVEPPVRRPYKLFSPGHVAWAAFLGAPLAGCVVMAVNYWRVGKPRAAWVALLCGGVATLALLGVGFVVPDRFPNFIIPAAYTFAMLQVAKSLQGATFDQHIASGGRKASAWAATGVAVVCLLILLAALFGILMALALAMPDDWLAEGVSAVPASEALWRACMMSNDVLACAASSCQVGARTVAPNASLLQTGEA